MTSPQEHNRKCQNETRKSQQKYLRWAKNNTVKQLSEENTGTHSVERKNYNKKKRENLSKNSHNNKPKEYSNNTGLIWGVTVAVTEQATQVTHTLPF